MSAGDVGREPPADARRRALTLIDGNQLQPARALLSDLCRDDPGDAEAWFLLGRVHGKLGELEPAGECTRRALELRPDYVDAHINLGKVFLGQGRDDDALRSYQTALELDPRCARAHSEIAYLHVRRGDQAAAEASYRAAVALDPAFAEACYNLGNLMRLQQRPEEAEHWYEQALRADPRYAAAHNNLGAVLYTQGRAAHDEERARRGIEHMRRALELDPDRADACNNLAGAYGNQGNHAEAARLAQRAMQLDPNLIEARITLAETRLRQGMPEAAVAILREALQLQPDNAEVFSSVLMYMHYLDDYSPEQLLEQARAWGAQFGGSGPPPVVPVADPDPRRRLRLGYISGDFREHPVGYFIGAALAHHDRAQYEVYCYDNGDEHDALTRRLQGWADHWRPIERLEDAAAAELIRGDGIDILVDLSGHTAKNRLPLFARRAAPVQVTWLGYFGTTGVAAMDYIIGDRFVIPPEEEGQYTERVVRLPQAYLCFSPPAQDIPVSPPPALSAGHVTFGSFQNATKVRPRVIACWAKLLQAVPGSQLYLKYSAFGDTEVQRRHLDLFAAQGVPAERVRFSGQSPRAEYLAAYREADIALDPFPFNGCTTTMEALWMGVPVVTLRGDRYVGHMSETILRHLDLEECITDDEEAYIARAAALASDPHRLAELRGGLRARLLSSCLCDGPAFARGLEAAYRRMWETRCGAAPESA